MKLLMVKPPWKFPKIPSNALKFLEKNKIHYNSLKCTKISLKFFKIP